MLMLPRRYRQQPPLGALIDHGHRLMKKATLLCVPGWGRSWIKAASEPATSGIHCADGFGVSSVQGRAYGSAIVNPTGGTGGFYVAADCPDTVFINGNTELTVFMVRRHCDTTLRTGEAFSWNSSSSQRVLTHAPYTDGNWYWDCGADDSTHRLSTAWGSKDTNLHTIVMVASATRGREMWRNGVLLASDVSKTGSISSLNTGDIRLGVNENEEVYLAGVVARAWAPDEITEWTQNPWALFYQRRKIFLPPAAATPYYVDVTIAAGHVASDLTDFPVMISLADFPAGFWSHVTSDGRDIRATTTAGVSLPCDLARWDYAGHTGTIWVKKTVATASSTVIRVTYGDSALSAPSVGSTYGRNAVWSDYKGVFLLGDTTVTDRTGIGDASTATSAGPVTYASTMPLTGGGSAASDVNGISHVIASGRGSSTTWTMAVTFSHTTIGTVFNRSCASYYGNDSTRATIAYRQSSATLGVWDYINSWLFPSSSIVPTLTQAYRVHAVYNGTTDRKLYVDGTQRNSASGAISAVGSSLNQLWLLNGESSNSEGMNGKVGFAYIRHSVLSADWIAAEYSNLNAPTSFYAVGSEAGSGGGAATRRPVVFVAS